MSQREDDTEDDSGDLLRALAWTPAIAPFTGTERYRVETCLGEGGFGVVYEVVDRDGRRLALKTLKPQRNGFAANIRRLKSEFRSVADLVHPNLVGLHELASHGDRWFFTMELVRGRDFLTHVRQRDEHVLRETVVQLARGVAALHAAGIIHRDLKPSNVLVEPAGRVVILDFGLAGDSEPDYELRYAGTRSYMAPELATTPPADCYSIGVMLHEALTGSLPPEHPIPFAHPFTELARLCTELLSPVPGARPTAGELLERLGSAGVPRRAAPSVAFVGRKVELATLRASFAAVSCGESRWLRIHGEPGVGKSALVAQALAGFPREAVVFEGRCYEREDVPFKAFDGIADALARYLTELGRDAVALLPRDFHLVTQLFPILDGVEALREIAEPIVPVDAREQRQRAFAAIKELLARIGETQPLVIAIDDLQWGDLDSARLLSHLVTSPGRPRMMLVLCYRSGDDSATLHETLRMFAAAGAVGTELAIAALPPADAELLACQLVGTGDHADAVRTIARRGEGHPLFMSELARAQASSSTVVLPSLIDILWQRVADLTERARILLETIAIAGQPIATGLCFEAAGLGANGPDVMRLLRGEQLVRAGERDTITVFHDRIRDAVLVRADPATQRVRHLALARSLERAASTDPETLARHFDAGDEAVSAARYAIRAGDAAMRTLAFDRAASLYRLALDRDASVASAALREKLGNALLDAGHNTAAGEAYLEAAELAEGDHATDLLRRGAEQLLTVGDVERGHTALTKALAAVGEALPATPNRARMLMLYHMVRLRLRGTRVAERDASEIPGALLLRLDVLDSAARGLDSSDPMRAMAIGGKFSRLALASGDPRRAALGLERGVFGFCGNARMRPAVVDEILDEADAIGTRIGEPRVVASGLFTRGLTHFAFGNWPATVELCERAAAIMAEQCTGMGSEHRQALLNVASSHARMGQFAEAGRVGDALLLDATERGDRVAEKNVCVIHAYLRLVADDISGAGEFLARCAIEDRCISIMIRAEATAAVALYQSCPADAIAAWRDRWKQLDDMGVWHVGGFRTLTARSLGVALIARGEARDLKEAAGLVRWIRRFGFPYAHATTATLQALAAIRAGRLDRAITLLDTAATDHDRAHMPLDAVACRHRRAVLAGDTANADAALARLRTSGIADPRRWAEMVLPVP